MFTNLFVLSYGEVMSKHYINESNYLPTHHHTRTYYKSHSHKRRNALGTEACTNEGEVCSLNRAEVCRNGTCVSACTVMGMKECSCDTEEDNYCFLCCGNSKNQCLPAHEYSILKSNGERWERESCTNCRVNRGELEGLPCDDRDPQRLCLQGKCSKSVCYDKTQGAICDRKKEKICVDDICDNPCSKIEKSLMVCDCPLIDPDTGFASEDRCQLCCYDFNTKPSNRRCQNAYRKYGITDSKSRPIWRVGLPCAGGKTCNRYGLCSNTNNVYKNYKPKLVFNVLIVVSAFISVQMI
uniref:Disintegrin domain-containing protein n=1 Tax=Strongyloides venezuelensis TaxID=75913 RepID=A0A0K0EUT1_STRVS